MTDMDKVKKLGNSLGTELANKMKPAVNCAARTVRPKKRRFG